MSSIFAEIATAIFEIVFRTIIYVLIEVLFHYLIVLPLRTINRLWSKYRQPDDVEHESPDSNADFQFSDEWDKS